MIPCLGALEFEIHHASVCIYHVFLIYLHARFLKQSTPRYKGADFNGPTSIVDCLTHCASSSASPQKCNAHSWLKASDRNNVSRLIMAMSSPLLRQYAGEGGSELSIPRRACQILFGADIVIANE